MTTRLVGGLYGVVIGRMFFGESMFARRSDASKVAFVHLVLPAPTMGFPAHRLPDVRPLISRRWARARLAAASSWTEVGRLVQCEPVAGPWTLDPDLAESV